MSLDSWAPHFPVVLSQDRFEVIGPSGRLIDFVRRDRAYRVALACEQAYLDGWRAAQCELLDVARAAGLSTLPLLCSLDREGEAYFPSPSQEPSNG
jgi:hypothetical protein